MESIFIKVSEAVQGNNDLAEHRDRNYYRTVFVHFLGDETNYDKKEHYGSLMKFKPSHCLYEVPSQANKPRVNTMQ